MQLIPWIWSLFTSILAYFAQFLGKRLSIVAAAITAFTSIVITLKTAIDALIASIYVALPTGFFLFGFGLLPDNTAACLTAISSGLIASQVYVYWRNIIAFRLTGA